MATTAPPQRVQPGGLLRDRGQLGDDALLRRPGALDGDHDRGAGRQAALDQAGGGGRAAHRRWPAAPACCRAGRDGRQAASSRGRRRRIVAGEGPGRRRTRGAAERDAGVGGDGRADRDAGDDVERHPGAGDGQRLLHHRVAGVRVARHQPDDRAAGLGRGRPRPWPPRSPRRWPR